MIIGTHSTPLFQNKIYSIVQKVGVSKMVFFKIEIYYFIHQMRVHLIKSDRH